MTNNNLPQIIKSMNNVINFQEFKEKKCQKDSKELDDLINDIKNAVRNRAINDIDELLKNLSDMHKDLFKVCNWKYYFSCSEDINPWASQDLNYSPPEAIISIPKQDYEQYQFLKKLVSEIGKKYNF